MKTVKDSSMLLNPKDVFKEIPSDKNHHCRFSEKDWRN